LSEKVFDGGLPSAKPVAVGIDQSLTGFAMCVVDIADPTKYEVWVYSSPNKGVQRLNDIAHFIASKFEFLEENGNDVYDIAMEGTVLHSQAASVLGELAGVVKLVLFSIFEEHANERLKTPLQVPPMTLKKFVSGKGTATKDLMLLNVYKRYGVELSDNNAADAYGLARIAAEYVIDDVEKGLLKKLQDRKFRDFVAD
jgi:Holliday junction resolvasome RuvABC endonuclease subunit